MGNFVSIDPGSPSGVTIFDQNGHIVIASQVNYDGAIKYLGILKKINDVHDIEFALIEKYEVFTNNRRPKSQKVQTQVQLLTEAFPNHILVNTMQWNPSKHTERSKKMLCIEIFGDPLRNSHIRDSALMGRKLFEQVQYVLGPWAFEAMKQRSITVKKWPTRKDLSWFAWWEEFKAEQKSDKKQQKMELKHAS